MLLHYLKKEPWVMDKLRQEQTQVGSHSCAIAGQSHGVEHVHCSCRRVAADVCMRML